MLALDDRIALAATRITGETSAGFDTSLVIHVLTLDGAAVETIEAPSGPSAFTLRTLRDDDGDWLTWTSRNGEVFVWQFRRRPGEVSAPRPLGTLYFSPAMRLIQTGTGPSLAWSTATEEGLVPLCHSPSAPTLVTVPMSEAWPASAQVDAAGH